MEYIRYKLPNGDWTDFLHTTDGTLTKVMKASHISDLEASYGVIGIEAVVSKDADPAGEDAINIPPSLDVEKLPKDKRGKMIEALNKASTVKNIKDALLEYYEK